MLRGPESLVCWWTPLKSGDPVKFSTYIDNRFQEDQVANADPTRFSWGRFLDGNACQIIIHTYVFLCSLPLIPWILLGFVAANLGLGKKPAPILAEAMNREVSRKNRLARKVGMSQKPKEEG